MTETLIQAGQNGHSKVDPMAGILSDDGEPKNLGQSLYRADKNLPMKTRLTGNLVSAIAIAEAYNEIYNLPELASFYNAIMKGRVSLNGKGRDEGVEISKNIDNRNAGINIMR